MDTNDTTFKTSNVIDITNTADATNSPYTLDFDDNLGDMDQWLPDTITIGDGMSNDLVINRPGKQPLKVADTLEKIMDRLSIIEPDFDKMDRYPALEEAYNNYKIIEAMLVDGANKDNG